MLKPQMGFTCKPRCLCFSSQKVISKALGILGLPTAGHTISGSQPETYRDLWISLDDISVGIYIQDGPIRWPYSHTATESFTLGRFNRGAETRNCWG